MSRIPRWYTLGHIEGQQSALASTMLNAAKGSNPVIIISILSLRYFEHWSFHVNSVFSHATIGKH